MSIPLQQSLPSKWMSWEEQSYRRNLTMYLVGRESELGPNTHLVSEFPPHSNDRILQSNGMFKLDDPVVVPHNLRFVPNPNNVRKF